MLDKIISFSIKNKLAIGIFTLVLVIWGIWSAYSLPIDAVPDITNNQVQILTVSPSLAAEDIERLVAFPVEQTMASIPGIEEVRSFSRFGLSVVTIVFEDDVDVYWARQQVNERLTEAKTLIPEGAGTPELAPLTTGLGEIYQYVIHPKKGYEQQYNAMELRTIQDWIVRRQLIGTKGVADVSSFGGQVKQYEIAVNPDKLKSMQVSMQEILLALQKNNQNTGGAYIDNKPNAYFIRTEGLVNSITDIENILVKTTSSGVPILVRNVAKVGFGSGVRYGAMTRNNDGEVVGAVVMMLKGENSSVVIENVKERIKQIEKNLPEGVVIEPFLDRTKLVDNAISTVLTNLIEGALIVIFVLVLMLGNLRAGLLVASVIPLAMLFAVAMMRLFNVSGNLMSLGAIDFGLIVDGALIIVEATLHHLGARQLLAKYPNGNLTPSNMNDEVFQSASKMRSAAAFGEIIILIVYLPILALVGIEGKMFKPMAQTVSFAIVGAFILSITYIPMMASWVLPKQLITTSNWSDKMMVLFNRLYAPILQHCLRKKRTIVVSSLVLFACSSYLFVNLGGEFIPTLDEGDFAVETRVLQGSSISQTIDASLKASQILLKEFDEVKEVIGKIGSSEIPTDPMPIEACDLIVVLKDKRDWVNADSRDELAQKMANKLSVIPGVTFGFQQPIQMRFNELMTGARQDVVVKVYGEDLNTLSDYAQKIGKLASKLNGAHDIYVEQVIGQSQLVVTFNREKLAQFGLTVEQVNEVIRAGFAGQTAGFVYEGEKRFELKLRLEKNNRNHADDLTQLMVALPNGNQIPIAQIADVGFKESPNQIQRDDAKRRIVVGFNVRGRDVEGVVNELQAKIDKQLKFKPGYYTTFGGSFKNLMEAKKRLSVAVPVALLLIFLMLFFTVNSIKQSLLIFTAIPLSAIGGVFALWIRDMPFSISAGVGFIALFGVAVLNGIVLIAEFNRLKMQGIIDLNTRIMQGTKIRLRPVLLTAMVASLGFLPMALSNGAGAEVQKPLATVVIGGLITATFLTLMVLPVLYWFAEQPKVKLWRLVLLFLLFIPQAKQLQAQTNNTQLILKQLIDSALVNNKGVQSAQYEIQYNKALKKTSTEIGKTNVSFMYGQYNSMHKDNNITISQSIPFPTVFGSQHKLNQSYVKGAELKLKKAQNELVTQIKVTFNHYTYLLEERKIWLKQDSIYTDFVKLAELKYTAGEGNLLEKINAQTQSLDVKNKLMQNQTEIANVKMQLQTLVNSALLFDEQIVGFDEWEFGFTIDSVSLQNNPEWQYFKQQIEISENQKKVESAKVLPEINVGYFNQSLVGYQNVNGIEEYFDGTTRFSGLQVGLSIPLWIHPHTATIKAASINKKVVQSEFEQFKLSHDLAMKQAIQNYLKHKHTLLYCKETALPNAVLITTQATKGFKAGQIGYVEFLHSVNQALQIQLNHIQTLEAYNQSVITLHYLIGNN